MLRSENFKESEEKCNERGKLGRGPLLMTHPVVISLSKCLNLHRTYLLGV